MLVFFLFAVAANCQSGVEQKSETYTPSEKQLVIVATIEERLYDRPTVKGFAITMVEPQEMLQVTDTTNYFFYKVKLQRAQEMKEGYILKAAFVGKPFLVSPDSLQAVK